MEKVFFDGELGKICANYYDSGNRDEIIIVIHGFGSSKETESIISVCDRLLNISKSCLAIDLDDCGESELEHDNSNVTKYVKQVESVINYCKTLNYENISIVGGSFAGIVTMQIAKLDPSLRRIFLRCPGSGLYYRYLMKGKEKEFESAKKEGFIVHKSRRKGNVKHSFSIVDDVAKYYPLTEIAKDIKIPVGIIHGDKDEAIDVNDTIEFSKYIDDCKLHIIKGAGHNLGVNRDFSEGLNFIVDFFKN